jgi:Site-specific recombinases, DNA invertase Pin homologs
VARPRLRCAIYTRKSSEEGLEQEFNSLHAQREACEAYVKSQAGEGWAALPTAYDDGGVSGGTMERDGLQKLLADVAAGRIDVVVVYKVDRLTRALNDFARIVEVFDKHGVSFVSVTQAFNTTTSMGRLTLNVLLSFAQFEREVTGERIRDKIAASKKKGMWMGGCPPLGYDPDGRKLKLNEPEAELVRHIFRRFLELQSVPALRKELTAEGRVSKRWTATTGTVFGGMPFDNGALYHLLRNKTYLGMVPHKDQAYPADHPPIIDQATFDRAEAQLATRARRGPNTKKSDRPAAPPPLLELKGRLFDCDGTAMTPMHAYGRRGGVHRYYVSSTIQRGKKERRPGAIHRLPALPVERWAIETLHRLCPDRDPQTVLTRMDVHDQAVQIALPVKALALEEREIPLAVDRVKRALQPGETVTLAGDRIWVHVPRRLKFRGGRAWLEGEAPKQARLSRALIKALKRAHQVLDAHVDEDGVMPQSPSSPHERNLVRMAWLAPDVQLAFLEGRQKAGVCLEDLRCAAIPLCWDDQRAAFVA